MNSLWFIIAALAIIFLEAIIYRRLVFKGLTINRSFGSRGVFPGDSFTLEFTLVNNKMLPVSWLDVQQVFPMGLNFINESMVSSLGKEQFIHRLNLYILPFQKVIRKYVLRVEKRGFYEIKGIDIETTNLFGTEKYYTQINAPAFISVYPKLIDLRDSMIIASSFQGENIVKRWILEDPLTILGIRDYQSSDNLKNVNWKATAKHGELKVNTYAYTADTKAIVLYNLEANDEIWKGQSYDEVEKTIEAAASLIQLLIRQGIPCGFATNALMAGQEYDEFSLRFGSDNKHFINILDHMARIQMYKKCHITDTIRKIKSHITWGTVVLIVTPVVNDEMLQELRTLGMQDIKIIALQNRLNKNLKDFPIYYFKDKDEQHEKN